MRAQPQLFEPLSPSLPSGFSYRPELLTAAEEQALVRQFAGLPFKQFEFQGFLGKRRVVSFGWRYDFNGGGLNKAEDIPAFLLPIRAKAAAFAQTTEAELAHVLLTEYSPGATIGWHKDRAVFGRVIGISLLAPCNFASGRELAPSGNVRRSPSSRAPPICSTALPAPYGSTASRRSPRCATRSRSGRCKVRSPE